MIPDEIVEQVRDSADLVGMIGESVELKRTGADYRGPCPFHGGTHRNFSVIPKKGRYYCFVCHESGDVFSWLMKRFGMDYPSAVREVARRSGIVVPERTARAGPDPLEPLFSAVAVAQDWYMRRLLESSDAKIAREYLVSREIPLETAALYGLGFASAGKPFLDAMTELGLEEPVLLEAGLAARRDDGSIVARFRGRLLFPIHDLRGRVAGFGGRLLGPGEPKYLNSPENAVFHKGKQLYNLHQAKGAIRKEETVILVEGYFDVLRLLLAGIEHVVAPLGTALTPDQGALLKRFAPAAILLYDSDQAGLRATFRAGDELLRHGMRVRVATLPPGEDPDTLVRTGGTAALEPILTDAVDLLERKIQLLERKGWFEGVDHQRDALDRLLPTIRATADPISRDLYLKMVSERTGVSREVLLQQVAARPAVNPPAAGTRPGDRVERTGRSPARRRVSSAERDLLRVLIKDREWLTRAAAEVPPEWFETPELREVYESLQRSPENVGSGLFLEQLSPPARQAWAWLDSIEPKYGAPDPDRTYVDACRTLEARPLVRKLNALTRKLREQAAGLAASDFDALIQERSRLTQELTSRFPEEMLKRPIRRGDIDAR
ncbi:MAG TPA: DNA primase [Gemmatimonadales bacterium]|jgi:DNA primase|nr:DNA primase [Gemmatimonadales bacterium]